MTAGPTQNATSSCSIPVVGTISHREEPGGAIFDTATQRLDHQMEPIPGFNFDQVGTVTTGAGSTSGAEKPPLGLGPGAGGGAGGGMFEGAPDDLTPEESVNFLCAKFTNLFNLLQDAERQRDEALSANFDLLEKNRDLMSTKKQNIFAGRDNSSEEVEKFRNEIRGLRIEVDDLKTERHDLRLKKQKYQAEEEIWCSEKRLLIEKLHLLEEENHCAKLINNGTKSTHAPPSRSASCGGPEHEYEEKKQPFSSSSLELETLKTKHEADKQLLLVFLAKM